MTMKRTRSVTCELSIKAPVDAVWKALTEADELMKWFPTQARTKPGKGGSIFMSWDGAWAGESKIEIWEPNRHLRVTWPWQPADVKTAPGAPPPIAVDYYLEAKGGDTVLRLVHSGFGMGAEWDNEYDGVSGGWNFELRSLQNYLERHKGAARRAIVAARRTSLSREDAWAALFGAPGLVVSPALASLGEGDACSIRMPWGETFDARVLIADAPQFSVVIKGLNDAMFRMEVFPAPPGPSERPGEGSMEAWLWFSLWGVDEGRAAAIEREANAAIARMLPD